MELDRSHVLITGASRGIGQALAEECLRRGATVSTVARSEMDPNSPAAASGRHFRVDLCNPDDLGSVIADVESESGPLDVLVNNAGIPFVGHAWEQDAADVRTSVLLNSLAPIELARQAIPGMLARGRGRIVVVSSLAGVGAFPTLAVYGAAKAAVAHHATVLDWELRGTPLGVTLVELGEVAGTGAATQGRQQSRTIAQAVDRMDRLRAMPTAAVPEVARQIANAIERERRNLVLPHRARVLSAIRRLPTIVNRVALAGIPAGPSVSPGTSSDSATR